MSVDSGQRVAASYTIKLHGEKAMLDAAAVVNLRDPAIAEEWRRRLGIAVPLTAALVPMVLYPAFTSDNTVAKVIAIAFLVFDCLWVLDLYHLVLYSVIDEMQFVFAHLSPDFEFEANYNVEIGEYGVVERADGAIVSVTPLTAFCSAPYKSSHGTCFTILRDLASDICLRSLVSDECLCALAEGTYEKNAALFIPKEVEEKARVVEYVEARVKTLSESSWSYLEDGKICTETSDPDYLEWLQKVGCKARSIK